MLTGRSVTVDSKELVNALSHLESWFTKKRGGYRRQASTSNSLSAGTPASHDSTQSSQELASLAALFFYTSCDSADSSWIYQLDGRVLGTALRDARQEACVKSTESFDLVVIGCGPAGEKAGAQAAYFGKRVAVIERAQAVGGSCVNTGTVPSKTLRESALYFSGLKQRGLYGIDYSLKENLTIGDFMHHERTVVEMERQRILKNLELHKIELVRGQASFENPHTVIVGGPAGTRRLRGEVILISTGSKPHRPAEIAFDDVHTFDSDTFLRMNRIPKSLAVIGGGVIGFPALASTSMEQGRVAVCHAFGLKYKERVPSLLPMGIYTIPEISAAGEIEESCKDKGIDYCVGRALYENNARGHITGDTSGMLKLIFARTDRRLLGVSLIGESATELIHIGMLVLDKGLPIDEFIEQVFNYPTLSEMYKYAAYDGLGNLAGHKLREG